jgi:hypothetical protein
MSQKSVWQKDYWQKEGALDVWMKFYERSQNRAELEQVNNTTIGFMPLTYIVLLLRSCDVYLNNKNK